MHVILWDFEMRKDHQIPARWPDLVIITKKEKKKKKRNRTHCIEESVVLADRRIKIKENEKRDKYEDLARE